MAAEQLSHRLEVARSPHATHCFGLSIVAIFDERE